MKVRAGRKGARNGGLSLLQALAAAGGDLRRGDDRDDTRSRLCRSAAAMADAEGAVLYLAGPGRLITAGIHGAPSRPARGELEVDGRIERVVRDGTIELLVEERGVAVPVVGVGGTLGAIAVHRAGGAGETSDALAVLGQLAGPLFELAGVVRMAGAEDPVRGIGDRQRASAAIASLEPGDAAVVLELDDLIGILATDGAGAVELAQVQLGLHLRNAIRPGDVVSCDGDDAVLLVLRQLRAPLGQVVSRVLGRWAAGVDGRTVSAGAALHLQGRAPMDTHDLARRTMQQACQSGPGRLYLASEAS